MHIYRYDSEYDDLRLASASAGGPLLSDVESDFPVEMTLDAVAPDILDTRFAPETSLNENQQTKEPDDADQEVEEEAPISILIEEEPKVENTEEINNQTDEMIFETEPGQ